MKGGKGGRKRKGTARTGGKPGPVSAKTKSHVAKRAASGAPKKGSRKNTEFGWSSTSNED
jgi:hypothetical protein